MGHVLTEKHVKWHYKVSHQCEVLKKNYAVQQERTRVHSTQYLSVSGEDRKNPKFPRARSLPDYGQRLSNPAGVRMAEGNENVTLEKKCCFHILLGSHKEEASNIILLGGFRV